jgi:hypothetical protein
VDKIIGLDGVLAEAMMVRTPDGSGKLELVKYHAPADNEGPDPSPANRLGFRHIAALDTDQVPELERSVRSTYDQMALIKARWARFFDFGAGRTPRFLQSLASDA